MPNSHSKIYIREKIPKRQEDNVLYILVAITLSFITVVKASFIVVNSKQFFLTPAIGLAEYIKGIVLLFIRVIKFLVSP